jgi:outer membrane protein TolC
MIAVPDMTEEMHDPILLTFSVNVPVWWQKYDAGVRQARHRYIAAVRTKAEKTNSLGVEVKTAAYEFRNADRKLSLYRDDLLPKAEQAVRSTQAAYQTGSADLASLLEAQRIFLEFQLSRERALADRQQALARLEWLVGRPVTIGQAQGVPRDAAPQPVR